jgi:2-C-methyl-D-erythritol 4-phosphate cytidylyltransferase
MQLYGLENTKDFDLAYLRADSRRRQRHTARAGQPKQYSALAGKPMLWHAVRSVCVRRSRDVFVVLAPRTASSRARLERLRGQAGAALLRRRDAARLGVQRLVAAIWRRWMPTTGCSCTTRRAPACRRATWPRSSPRTREDSIGGILALPAADTVKKAGKDEGGALRVIGTEDRSQLWLAQTPQMFRCGLLMQALKEAREPVTDEAAAIEQMGLQPRLVAGSRENIKVTFAEDLTIAEAILGKR